MINNNELVVDIDNLLNKNYIFYAHKKETCDETDIRTETIQEHTNRCLNHFYEITKARNLETVFMNFKRFLFPEKINSFSQLFEVLVINTMAFHDIGKVNPLFQRQIMNNKMFLNEKANTTLGSDHSIVSAILYLEYFLPKSNDFPKDIRNKFRFITYINAYVISKHHGSLNRFEDFINKFCEKDSNYKYLAEMIQKDYQKFFNINFFPENKYYCTQCAHSAMRFEASSVEEGIAFYAYERLIYSLLVASDYYATSEFNHNRIIANFHGSIEDINIIRSVFRNTYINKSIDEYRKSKYYDSEKCLDRVKDINILRNELYLDAEGELLKHLNDNLYYLEAPTGSGKSNVAFNLSFHLIEHCKDINKIMYIYPFNTLVEQNLKSIEKVFGHNEDIMVNVSVVNSVTPIIKEGDIYCYEQYEKALLDRQFFNYPITLSTHVTFFDLLFGINKESGFAFYQICNSVIILDEIQSYKNSIWTEIITFLKVFSKILNMKVIIMSATLPDLDLLTEKYNETVKLIIDRSKYFRHPLFKDRVELNYDLLNVSDIFEELYRKIYHFLECGKKVLVEFITKKSAINFYRYFIENMSDKNHTIELMTGDDNNAERERIISEINNSKEGQAFLLISTQVLEAGVDLDNMDIGFKDISKLDSEEQFMGRINRSNKKAGIVYFFRYDNAKAVYKKDARINDELTLKSEAMRTLLQEKRFDQYYHKVLEMIRGQNNSLSKDKSINEFFLQVMKLNAPKISERMKLIDDDEWCCTVFLNRKITLINGEILVGEEIWNEYKQLMTNKGNYGYAEWRARLSIVKSKMSYFTYQVNKSNPFPYTEQLGEIFFISDADQYFEGSKFIREKFEKQIGIFI